ncbi:MAG: hypothetical protein GY803_02550, partial [Chloroflexi bacterium]|nr:hypothetical protein [Chloroflexota bacterium]
QIVEERQLIPSIIWVGSLTLFIAVAFIFIHRSERFETAIDTFVKRLAVLSFIYLLVDIVSLILVVIRNF